MSPRAAARLAWSACALSLTLTLLSLLLLVLNFSHPDVPVYSFWIENILFSAGFSTVGAVVVPRIPSGNRIGWLFCAIGLLWAVAHFAAEYAIYALLAAPGTLPAGEVVSWFYSWPPFLALGLLLVLVLLFPDGRLPGDRWRWLARIGVISALVGTFWSAFAPGPIGAGLPFRNPLGIEGLPSAYAPMQAFMFGLIALAVASLLVRRFRARGVERLQIRWFAYAFAVAAGGVILKYVIAEPLGLVWLGRIGYALDLAGTVGIPISMGIAIMRYRLYDIDRLINRTLVYGTLTFALALLYLGAATLTQVSFDAITGRERLPQLTVVVSTLAIAALFNPLRRRIQTFIDRRFYRQKYDARETLETFSFRLRDKTDLGALSAALVGVVAETVQPEYLSLWLRPDTASKKHRMDRQQPPRDAFPDAQRTLPQR